MRLLLATLVFVCAVLAGSGGDAGEAVFLLLAAAVIAFVVPWAYGRTR